MSLRLNYIAPADNTGYACAAAQYLRLLRALGAEVHFQPLRRGSGLGLSYECAPVAGEPLRDAITILHAVPEYYAPLKGWLRERGCLGKMAAMTVWETSRLPRHWPAILNGMDAVMVPSAWNREVFVASGVSAPVYCLPHASEFGGRLVVEEVTSRMRARWPELAGKFVFYSIGAQGYRKGNDLLLRAFAMAFAGAPDVVLLLKTSASSQDARPVFWRRAMGRLRGEVDGLQAAIAGANPQVVVVTEELAAEEIAALHAMGDCYVSCSRGEGWGMGLYEAAWFGKPVLAPDRGGHRAFLPEGMKGLVRSSAVAVRMPGKDGSYTEDQCWDEVDVLSMAEAMRGVVRRWEEARAEARELALGLRERFADERIAEEFWGILEAMEIGAT